MANQDYDVTELLESLQAIELKTATKEEMYDQQLNTLYEWVRSGFISCRDFKNLLSMVIA